MDSNNFNQMLENHGFSSEPFRRIQEHFALSEFEFFCVQSAFAAEIESSQSYTFDTALKAYIELHGLKQNDSRIHGAYKSFTGNKPISHLLTFQSGGEFRLKEEVFRFILGDLPLEQISTGNLIKPAFDMDDLILDQKTTALLELIIQTLKLRPKLYSEYGFGKLFPYGRGIGILFHGASGTGKTMAVQALASRLELRVMKADISQIIDKYIGETEKHLTEIFEKAKQSDCILFFDEADSLFAARTEVSDSRDRSANSQTAHLLQKMEEYDGAVVLATNLIDNIDDAFKRRLPFIVEFNRPDAALRKIMWRKFIPAEMPIAADVDFDFLAERYELTPAVIKWTAFSAAVRAVSVGVELGVTHILDSLRYEHEKVGAMFRNTENDKLEIKL